MPRKRQIVTGGPNSHSERLQQVAVGIPARSFRQEGMQSRVRRGTIPNEPDHKCFTVPPPVVPVDEATKQARPRGLEFDNMTLAGAFDRICAGLGGEGKRMRAGWSRDTLIECLSAGTA